MLGYGDMTLATGLLGFPGKYVTNWGQPDVFWYEFTLRSDPGQPLIEGILPRPKGAGKPHFPYGQPV